MLSYQLIDIDSKFNRFDLLVDRQHACENIPNKLRLTRTPTLTAK